MLRIPFFMTALLIASAGESARADDGAVVNCLVHFQVRDRILAPAPSGLDAMQQLVRDFSAEARRLSDRSLMDFLEAWAADRIRTHGHLSGVLPRESAPTTFRELFAGSEEHSVELKNVYGNVTVPLFGYLSPRLRTRLLARGAPPPELVAGFRLGVYLHERVLRETRRRLLEADFRGLISEVELQLAPLR